MEPWRHRSRALVPSGYATLLEEMSLSVIQKQPTNIVAFCIAFLESRSDSFFTKKEDEKYLGCKSLLLNVNDEKNNKLSTCNKLVVKQPLQRPLDKNKIQDEEKSDENSSISERDDTHKTKHISISSKSLKTDNTQKTTNKTATTKSSKDSSDSSHESISKNLSSTDKTNLIQSFKKSITTLSLNTETKFESNENLSINAVIDKYPIFKDLTIDERKQIAKKAKLQQVDNDEILINENDAGSMFYIIKSGTFEVYTTVGETINKIRKYNCSGYFGEMALIYDIHRAATVKAISKGVLWAIDKHTFCSIILPSILKRLKYHIFFFEEVELFKHLSTYSKLCISNALITKCYQPNEIISERLSDNVAILVVKTGTIEILKQTKIEKVSVVTLNENDFLGEIKTLIKQNTDVSISAVTEVELVTLDENTYNLYCQQCKQLIKEKMETYHKLLDAIDGEHDQTEESSSLISESGMIEQTVNRVRGTIAAESWNPEEIEDDYEITKYPKTDEERKILLEAVKHVIIFRAIEASEHNDLIDAMFVRKVKPGEDVIVLGESGDNFYIITDGTFDVFVKVNDEIKCVTQYVNKGSFGELALMYNTPRAATVRAVTDGTLWCMEREVFRNIVLTKAFKKRELYKQLLKSVSILKGLSTFERNNLADALTTLVVNKGETVFEKGDPGSEMYFIEEGEVSVRINNQEMSRLKRSDYFGELALLTKNPRAASVVALTQVKLAVLDVSSFERILGPCTDIMSRHSSQYISPKLNE